MQADHIAQSAEVSGSTPTQTSFLALLSVRATLQLRQTTCYHF
jgi:hypothetical protein